MQPTIFGTGTESAATLSPCRVYRYTLTRRWADGPPCNFLMLNPSTADETKSDPTITRCIGFAKAWGFGGLVVTNLFALRSTDPRELYKHAAPVGPDNDAVIITTAASAGLVVAAWGCHGGHLDRGKQVLAGLVAAGRTPHYLKITADGYPGHPLYLRADSVPRPLPTT